MLMKVQFVKKESNDRLRVIFWKWFKIAVHIWMKFNNICCNKKLKQNSLAARAPAKKGF